MHNYFPLKSPHFSQFGALSTILFLFVTSNHGSGPILSLLLRFDLLFLIVCLHQNINSTHQFFLIALHSPPQLFPHLILLLLQLYPHLPHLTLQPSAIVIRTSVPKLQPFPQSTHPLVSMVNWIKLFLTYYPISDLHLLLQSQVLEQQIRIFHF